MKVIRSTEWEPQFWVGNFPNLGSAYLFRHREYGDVLALKVVKFVDVEKQQVYIYEADSRTVTSRSDLAVIEETSLPALKVSLNARV